MLLLVNGSSVTQESVWEQQDSLNLHSAERLSHREIAICVERLRSRKILTEAQNDGRIRIAVPILADWLTKHAELTLLPVWGTLYLRKNIGASAGSRVARITHHRH